MPTKKPAPKKATKSPAKKPRAAKVAPSGKAAPKPGPKKVPAVKAGKVTKKVAPAKLATPKVPAVAKVAPAPTAPAPARPVATADERERLANLQRARASTQREAGPPPDIADVARRERCAKSFRLFCETYNPNAFDLGWAPDQLRAVARIEEAVTLGALFAFAMPRGGGKTTISRMGALWATLNAHCRYAFVIGATGAKGAEALDAVKTLIRFNSLLADDYPEVAHYARALGGIANRASGQTCDGVSTLIKWDADGIVLPTVPPPSNWPKHWPLRPDGLVPTSGVVIAAAGLTGEGLRGSVKTLTSGENVRPDFVLLDDPQTPESARSKIQNQVREQLVSADVLGMAGPAKKIAAVMPCTVIEPGDMVDSLLNRKKHPLWRGERTGILKSLPTNLSKWDAYYEVYARCAQLEPPDFSESNAYYIEHQEELEAGAEASWEGRKLPTELSAIQSAMHIRFRDPFAFAAEYMNDPKPLHAVAASVLDADEVARKVAANLPRLAVPRNCTRVTAFIDVGEHVLWYTVTAWDERYGGTVIDYGAWPDQSRVYFAAADARPMIGDLDQLRDMPLEAQVYAALTAVAERVCGRIYVREESGGELHLARCLIDANYGKLTDLVYDFCRRSRFASVLVPSHGKYIGPKSTPINAWPKRDEREQKGQGWRVSPAESGKRGQKVVFDTNWYKSFVAQRLRTGLGAPGCLTLWDAPQAEHQMFADHCAAEYPKPKPPDAGYTVDEWVSRVGRDNHLWDCLVGTAVAANIAGLRWDSGAAAGAPRPPRPRKKVKLSDRFREKHGGMPV